MAATAPDVTIVETAIVEMTNAFRADKKLATLKQSASLSAIARAYAKYLAKSGKFSHTADGKGAGDRITAGQYDWCQIGENLALNSDSRGFKSRDLAKKAVEGWINSPGHRANLVAEHMTEIGVGVVASSDKVPKYLSVQLFARPKSMQFEFQISNATKQIVTYSFSGETRTIEPSFAVTHAACVPGTIAFDKIGKGKSAKDINAKLEAAQDKVYMLNADAKAGLKIDIASREKVK
jgi:Cysteine-rich secretory protein family